MSNLNEIQINVRDVCHLLRAIDDQIFHMRSLNEEVREPIFRINAVLRAAITLAEKSDADISTLPGKMFHEE
uniref:hypothetical protein n=1 Tax=uncultured Rhizobium sp. TaxID=155567 RepID=UPI0026120BB0|nr:hypothetical protein [uncultured Rhizobium sp.]